MTAEEFLCEWLHCDKSTLQYTISEKPRETLQAFRKFAQFHVKEALKQVHYNFQLPEEDLEFTLNAYPKTNIK
jgi:hypothetical protein